MMLDVGLKVIMVIVEGSRVQDASTGREDGGSHCGGRRAGSGRVGRGAGGGRPRPGSRGLTWEA